MTSDDERSGSKSDPMKPSYDGQWASRNEKNPRNGIPSSTKAGLVVLSVLLGFTLLIAPVTALSIALFRWALA